MNWNEAPSHKAVEIATLRLKWTFRLSYLDEVRKEEVLLVYIVEKEVCNVFSGYKLTCTIRKLSPTYVYMCLMSTTPRLLSKILI